MRSHAEISSILRRWPREFQPNMRELARSALAVCTEIYDCTRAIAAWEETDEPWTVIASWTDGQFDCVEAVSGRFTPLTCAELEESTFAISEDGKCLTSHGASPVLSASAVNPNLREQYKISRALSLPLRGETIDGRVFLLGVGDATPEMLLMGDGLGLLMATQLDCISHVGMKTREAVAGERMRVARDLHDGLLQSFTGIVLRLETVHDILETEPEQARRMLTEVQSSIMADQRELRAYVETLGPRRRAEMKFDFRARLEEWRERFEKQWSIAVRFNGERLDPLVAELLGQETLRLIQEAVTNSAKHGAASSVDVTLTTTDGRMHIEVADNGTGFPFHGRRTLEEIRSGAGGPFVLAQRVAALNGDMVVDSGENGARIEMSIPLGFSGS